MLPCIERAASTIDNRWLLEPVFYTLKMTPGRRFRSALPTALSNFHSAATQAGAAAELLWATYTILDDLLDTDKTRYGTPTAWTVFGPARVAYAIPAAFLCADELLRACNITTEQRDAMSGAFARSIRAQTASSSTPETLKEIDSYLDVAHRRVEFVTLLWQVGLASAKQPLLGDTLFSIHKEAAIAGQIKNDIYGIWAFGDHMGLCTDVFEGRMTYPILAFLAKATEDDKQFLHTIREATEYDLKATTSVRELFERYNILGVSIESIGEYVKRIHAMISAFDFNLHERHLISGWLSMQFEQDIGLSITMWRNDLNTFPTIPTLT